MILRTLRPGRSTAGAALAGLGLVLAACSSGSPSPGATSTTSSGSSTTTAADTALARQELLPAAAFPKGWQAQGASSGNTGASFFGGASAAQLPQILQCLGMSGTSVDANPAEAAGPEYDDPNSANTVADTVDVFPTAAAAAVDVRAAKNPKAPSCMVQIAGSDLTKGAPKGAKVGALSAEEVSLPSYGDADAGISLHFPLTYQGVSGTFYLEFVVVQKGRSESNLLFTDLGTPPSTTLVQQMAADAAAALTT
ncbi:MAG TPA: hypothetical protein VE991_08600 [Acidimicrobiales bacterium]|nr:hypothetical protein [Acidimicrobiales bacterium]